MKDQHQVSVLRCFCPPFNRGCQKSTSVSTRLNKSAPHLQTKSICCLQYKLYKDTVIALKYFITTTMESVKSIKMRHLGLLFRLLFLTLNLRLKGRFTCHNNKTAYEVPGATTQGSTPCLRIFSDVGCIISSLRDSTKKTAGVDDVLMIFFQEQTSVPEHLRAVFLVEPDLQCSCRWKIQDDWGIYSRFICYIIYLRTYAQCMHTYYVCMILCDYVAHVDRYIIKRTFAYIVSQNSSEAHAK